MPFVAEDGTGLDDANSGADVGEANEYFTERGVAAWTGTTAKKQEALIRATDYVEMRFRDRFKNYPLTTTQTLSFPRIDDDAVEIPMGGYKRAIFEYALRTLDGTPLAPDPVTAESGLAVIAESHKKGPLTDTYRYASKGAGSIAAAFKPYPAADGNLRGLLTSTSGLIR